jgi:hypothetical protein
MFARAYLTVRKSLYVKWLSMLMLMFMCHISISISMIMSVHISISTSMIMSVPMIMSVHIYFCVRSHKVRFARISSLCLFVWAIRTVQNSQSF